MPKSGTAESRGRLIPNFLRNCHIDFHSLTCHSEQVAGDFKILIYDHDFDSDMNSVNKLYVFTENTVSNTMLVLPQTCSMEYKDRRNEFIRDL